MTKLYQNYVNGLWQDSNKTDVIDVLNPATEEVIAQIPNSSHEDADQAVAAAKKAFPAWNNTSVSERADYIEKIKKGLEANAQAIADAIIAELGATRTFSETGQVPMSISEIEATLDEVRNYQFEEKMDDVTIVKEGYGVVACITPWNYPLNQIQRKITPALLAGNTVVVKPSKLTPISAAIYAQVIEEAGLPDGVFNLVNGDGKSVGDYIAGHEDVDVISFTGSTAVGRGLYEKAAGKIKKLVLELGGKSPLIYLKGGDLDIAVDKISQAIINNQGQSCAALTRLLVPRNELANVNDALLEKFKDVVVGDPESKDTTVGPLVSADQQQTVLDYIQSGKDEGAKVLLGGHAIEGKGYYVVPTIFTDATNDMKIAQEEIFGPVLTIIPYDSVEDAIEIANDTNYGLSGAVVGPAEEAEKVARQIRTGNVFINDGGRSPRAPFGGYKESGIGRENGLYGVEEYLEVKALLK